MTTQSKDNHDKDSSKNNYNNDTTKNHSKDNQDHSKDNNQKGSQGFASMPHEKVQEIAKKGGETTHKGDNNSKHNDKK